MRPALSREKEVYFMLDYLIVDFYNMMSVFQIIMQSKSLLDGFLAEDIGGKLIDFTIKKIGDEISTIYFHLPSG